MKILVDTNVVLDILLKREEFVKHSYLAIKKAITNGDLLYFSSSSVTDVYYLVRKTTNSREVALDAVKRMLAIFSFVEVNEECVIKALSSNIKDYEDALIDEVAQLKKIDLILTRDANHFSLSKTPYLTPQSYFKN